MHFLCFNCLASVTLILQATFINSFPWDPLQTFNVDDLTDQTPNSDYPNLIKTTSPEGTSSTSESSINQDVTDFNELLPIQVDSLSQPPDPYLLQDLDSGSHQTSFDVDLNAGESDDSLTTDPIYLGPTDDAPVDANLRYDIWNLFPWNCIKLNLGASCCTGSEDENGVRHGCGRVASNQNCRDRSTRYCCKIHDPTWEQRTLCVPSPPDGEPLHQEDAWTGTSSLLFPSS